MSGQLYHIPELLWSFLMAVVSKSPITRKKNIGPPTIYYKNCHNRGLAHVPYMTRTPTRYPHRFIWVWCVGLDLRSYPYKWVHPKTIPGYVYGLCAPRSGSGSSTTMTFTHTAPVGWHLNFFSYPRTLHGAFDPFRPTQ